MTQPATGAATSSTTSGPDLSALSTDELRSRRGALAQGLQMAALEGLPLDDDDQRTVAALDAELAKRVG